jgi:hypothetical protein
MGSTELIANLFRISQTEEKLRKDEIDNAKDATSAHYTASEADTEKNVSYMEGIGESTV